MALKWKALPHQRANLRQRLTASEIENGGAYA